MSEREDDLRLERELREVLRERDPGPAPYGLRRRVARIPDTVSSGGSPLTRRLSRAVIPVLGLAAAITLLVLALPLLGPMGTGTGAGPSAAPVATFDPTVRGPGLVPPPPVEAEGIIVAALVLGIVLAVVGMRRERWLGFAALIVVAIVGYAGWQVLATDAVAGPVASSGGIGVRDGDLAPGSSGPYPVYITAGPGQPFSIGFSVENGGPLPIRLEGVVLDPNLPDPATFPTFRALWRDDAPDGLTGPAAPFSSIDLAPGHSAGLWLVGTAGNCAAGPSFAIDGTSFVGMPALRVRYTVLGIPRMDTIALPFDPMQPFPPGGCPT